MSDRLEREVQDVFRDLFDAPDLRIERSTTAQDVDGWDSLRHIDLIVAIEQRFRIRFKTSEVTALKNVGELIDAIARKKT